jgi:hypothetical protein
MKRNGFLFLLVLSGWAWALPAGPAETPAQAGVRLYNGRQFEAADAAWRTAAAGAPRNADLYYNLGNAAFRRQKLGEAVLYYRRALWLAPQHAETTYNLNYINKLLLDRVVPEPPGVPVLIRERLIAWLGVDAISYLFLAAFGVACLAGWYALRVRDLPLRRPAMGLAAGAAMLLILCGLLFWTACSRDLAHGEAVVLARRLDVRSGPSSGNPVLFTVHEGLLVELAAQTNGWRQVVLPNGWNGWVPADQLAIVQEFALPAGPP